MIEGKYFKDRELRCKCGCGRNMMSKEFLELLDTMREEMGPLKLSSAYRCPDHNEMVSSTGRNGPHTTGKAVDILCSGERAHHVIDVALSLGMSGIGISQKGPHNKRFIHIDMLASSKRPWVWSY